jgi:hypothetical protein
MRGEDEQTEALFSYLSPEAMVPAEHPLRLIRPVVNAAPTNASTLTRAPFGSAIDRSDFAISGKRRLCGVW